MTNSQYDFAIGKEAVFHMPEDGPSRTEGHKTNARCEVNDLVELKVSTQLVSKSASNLGP